MKLSMIDPTPWSNRLESRIETTLWMICIEVPGNHLAVISALGEAISYLNASGCLDVHTTPLILLKWLASVLQAA